MPIIKSAIKKMHQDQRKTERNDIYRARLKSTLKRFKKAVEQKKTAELPELMKQAYSIVDTAMKKHLLQRNTASRKKSRIARMAKSVMESKTAAAA